MSTLKIREALKNAGIEAKEIEVIKNAVKITGYQLETGTNVKPVLYYSQSETVEAFVKRAVEMMAKEQPKFDVNNLISRHSLLTRSYLCVQRKSEEHVVKKGYLNLDMYVRISVDSTESSEATIKVTDAMLKLADVTEDELFTAAAENSAKKAVIISMAEALGMPAEMAEAFQMYVGSYDTKIHGAAVLALPDVLHEFCNEKGFEKVYILPSSSEEVIIVPEAGMDPEELAVMVNEVNNTEVDATIQLDPVVYLYDDAEKTVTIAAEYASSVKEEV